ncbi:MAG: hypothetical protein AAF611_12330 [Bacteroidota bacterium]
MLQQIKNIAGVTELTKKEQQHCKGGFETGDYSCSGGEVKIQPYQACPDDSPSLHPLGEHRCCAGQWQEKGMEQLDLAL